jgi:hypothetical protein
MHMQRRKQTHPVRLAIDILSTNLRPLSGISLAPHFYQQIFEQLDETQLLLPV